MREMRMKNVIFTKKIKNDLGVFTKTSARKPNYF